MTTTEWELFFNVICFGIAIGCGGLTILMYRSCQPKFYGLLLWALVLALCAAFTYGLYSSLLVAFLEMKSVDTQVVAASHRLSEKMRLLSFVIPGLMLGVAANLITTFLQIPPRKKD